MDMKLQLTRLENLMSAISNIEENDNFDSDSKKAIKSIKKGLKDIEHDIKKIRKEVNGNK